MKPAVNIDFNQVFADTKINDELSAVVFGAELALRYSKASEAQLNEVKANIVRSAFNTSSLDYNKMAAAARTSGEAAQTPGEASSQTPGETARYVTADAPAADEPIYTEPSGSYNTGTSEYSVFDDINDNFEQTVVYENYPDPDKTAPYNPASADGFGNRRENIWEEPESGQDEKDAFGKIRWTTYASDAGPGGDSSSLNE